MNISQLIKLFAPDQGHISIREKLLSALAAFLAIAFVMAASIIWLAPTDLPWIVASMGASAVLLFAVPMGPLSQPWAFAGGHMISGFIGVSVALLLPDQTLLAASLAVSLAIFAMYVTHSLHPPGGATALSAVMGSAQIHAMGYQYLLTPVLVNVAIMLAWALIINNMLPNRCYPSGLNAWRERKNRVIGEDKADINIAISRDDLEYALGEMDEFLDVSEDDLTKIFAISADHARRKRMGELLCGDIMTKEVIHASKSTDIEEIWGLMRDHRIRGLPVVDEETKVIGIVTIADFLNQAMAQSGKTLLERFQSFIKKSDDPANDKPKIASQVMTTPAISARVDQHILDLFPLFYKKGIHHLPVIDGQGNLCGMITPKNLLIALHANLPGKG